MPNSTRLAAAIEYAGTAYHGWQKQGSPPLNTLQLQCEKALSQIANHPIEITCAGRTDKGVHALAQVIHFNTTAQRDMHAWVQGSNRYLPGDIRLLWANPMPDTFHARYSATARRYQYIIYNAPVRSALLQHRVTWYPTPLDIQPMIAAAQFLLGEHDFSAFRGADCQARTTIGNIEFLSIRQEGAFIYLDIQANAFLHHMVRNIVGVLLAIGVRDREPIWAQEVLIGRQRSLGGVTAAPDGLYLVEVRYPEIYQLPKAKDIFKIDNFF